MGEGWRSVKVGPEATGLEVSLSQHDRMGFGGWNEILFRSGGQWTRLVTIAPAASDSASESFARSWPWRWVRTAGAVLLHPVILVTLIGLFVGAWVMWCTRRRSPEPIVRRGTTRTMADRGRRR
jgi:hypothetical protein